MSNRVLSGLTGVGKVSVHRNICLGTGETSVCHGVGDEGSLLAQQCPTSRAYFREKRRFGGIDYHEFAHECRVFSRIR